MTRLYLYGVVEAGRPLDLLLRDGAGGDQLEVVASGRFVAIARRIACERGAEAVQEALRHRVIDHQRYVWGVGRRHNLLPARPLTLLEDETDLEGVLSAAQAVVGDAFDLMRDRVEIDLSAVWDGGQAPGEPAVMARGEGGRSMLPTVMDHFERRQAARLGLEERRRSLAARVTRVVQGLVRQTAGRPIGDDRTAMSAAFLIDRQQVGAFGLAVAALQRSLRHEALLRIEGPFAAGPFFVLEVTKPRTTDMGQAWKALGLPPGTIDEADILKAHSRLTARLQPRLLTEGPLTALRLAEVNEAASLLLSCLQRATADLRPAASRTPWAVRVRPAILGKPALPLSAA